MTGPSTPAGPASPPAPAAPAPAPAAPAPAPASLGRQVGAIVFDIAAPIALYYGLRAAGLSSLAALAIGAVIPAASAAWVLARKRRANMVALLVLGTMVASLIISVISDSPRFLLAKDGLLTSVWGIWFLVSLRARRPAAFLFARPLLEGGAHSRSRTGTCCGRPSRGSAGSGGCPR
jgi:hypothetical protein